MSFQYNGLSANISLPASLAIASSTNTTPIQITTSTAHGLTTGDGVFIQDHQANYNANGLWTVNVISTTQFTLSSPNYTATGVATGGATGLVYPLGYGSTFAEPSDGDPRGAASVQPPLSALGDRTALSLILHGQYRLAKVAQVTHDEGGTYVGTSWASTTTTGANVYNAFSSAGPMPWTVTGLAGGDIMDVEVEGVLATNSSWGPGEGPALSLFTTGLYAPGGAVTWGKASGSAVGFINITYATPYVPFVVRSRFGVTGLPGGSIGFQLYASGYLTNGNISLVGDYNFMCRVWRPTGLPQ
jgi:hypothetical protein